jgi:hypothetical protein
MKASNTPGYSREQGSGSYAVLVLRHRDRHGRRSVEPLRLDWAELISQANNSILRSVIRRAPELEKQIRAISYELFDLPNLTEPKAGSPALAIATGVEAGIKVVIFRRPIEIRASSSKARVSLIRFSIAQALAELLNVDIEIFNEN